ncbi:MAG: HAMP domain-containing sensor histidine kinase [Campylobacterota bacterium]|nr:HAMP domain-containing sensor histidine kinase [Campylobacterota bacterium]
MSYKSKESKIISNIENFLFNDYEELKENLTTLITEYKKKEKRLDIIIEQSDRQQRQVMQLNDELNEYKTKLEEKVEEEISKRKEKERLLYSQSKLAAMGEMMDAVAHQWKQPINMINMQVDMVQYDFEDNLVDEEYINQFQKDVNTQIKHMISTLNEFRSFFRPNKDISEFDVKDMINKVLLLTKDEFIKNQININVIEKDKLILKGIENEFKHLILNIINNSKDAFNENNITNRNIDINILKDKNFNRIYIEDNAGGIPDNIIDDIFKANVTTKDEDKGTGIGLYMSSQIAQKHNGTLSVENIDNGARFIFEQKKIENE